jgi:hypothetical protein
MSLAYKLFVNDLSMSALCRTHGLRDARFAKSPLANIDPMKSDPIAFFAAVCATTCRLSTGRLHIAHADRYRTVGNVRCYAGMYGTVYKYIQDISVGFSKRHLLRMS